MYYQVSYDLKNDKKYDKLYDGIKSYGTFFNILLSTWVVKADGTAQQVYDKLRPLIDADDALFISEVNANHMGTLSPQAAQWMNRQNI